MIRRSKSMICIPTYHRQREENVPENRRASLIEKCRSALKIEPSRRQSLVNFVRKTARKLRSTSAQPVPPSRDPETRPLYFHPKFWENGLLGQYIDVRALTLAHEEAEDFDDSDN
ncbi:unnamed protein product [Caenorhabditis angaria]|uniref:Uncharacterized protein n=1 Tax=Caenorhabditis angaria TaxID=860376 RepID=A0A9P1ITC6_9PELO|nr:unnamed protein product [Caenorhabditis angaria]